MAVIEEGLQGLAQVHHAGGMVLVQNVHVEPDPGFEFGLAEQLFHQRLGVDGAALGFQDDAHGVRRFVADVGKDGQLLGDHQFGDLLDQAGFLDLVGNFGNDDLVLAARQSFLCPLGP